MSGTKLQAGDRVAFLDEVGGGVVLRPSRPGHVILRTDDGFELERSEKGLVAVGDRHKRSDYAVSDHQAGLIAANDAMDGKNRRKPGMRPGKTPKKPEDNSVAEVDLHLHELVENESTLQREERLTYQLAFFERALESAIRDGKRKLIVIHGVGEGVLREEVRRVLQFYPGVQFHDADMRRYGAGATEVLILRH